MREDWNVQKGNVAHTEGLAERERKRRATAQGRFESAALSLDAMPDLDTDECESWLTARRPSAAEHRYWDNLKNLKFFSEPNEIRGAVRVAAPLFRRFHLPKRKNPSLCRMGRYPPRRQPSLRSKSLERCTMLVRYQRVGPGIVNAGNTLELKTISDQGGTDMGTITGTKPVEIHGVNCPIDASKEDEGVEPGEHDADLVFERVKSNVVTDRLTVPLKVTVRE